MSNDKPPLTFDTSVDVPRGEPRGATSASNIRSPVSRLLDDREYLRRITRETIKAGKLKNPKLPHVRHGIMGGRRGGR